MERYYSKDLKIRAEYAGFYNGKALYDVYYERNRCPVTEAHEIKLYEWAKHLHGNAPAGTPYGYFRASRNGKRIIITV